MINGLGLFAALGSPDASAPQPAPAEDPAVFAAALVAALGLRAAVQATPVAATPSTDAPAEPANDDPDSEAADGENQAVVKGEQESEPVEATPARPVVARVTPDPEIVKETSTLGAVLRGKGPTPKGMAVDLVSDEPAVPVAVAAKPSSKSPEAAKLTVTPDRPPPTEAVAKDDAKAQGAEPVEAKSSSKGDVPTVAAPEVVADVAVEATDNAPATRRPSERRGAKAVLVKDTVELTAAERPAPAPSAAPVIAPVAGAVTAPPVAAPVPSTNNPPVAGPDEGASLEGGGRNVPEARATTPARPQPVAQQTPVLPQSKAVADAARQVAESTPAPPQSVDERHARAMAENTRVERQLAELLGNADVTEFKVQLGRRPVPQQQGAPVADAPPAPERAAEGKVVWQRATPIAAGDTISGQMLPQPTPRVKTDHNEIRGTFAREAVEAVNVQSVSSEPITISTATARSEIVRMVANASRAMAPNVAATEGTRAVAKAPAPSMAPSLPVVRQELPADSARSQANDSDERDRKPAREASASDAASPSSPPVANNSTASAARSERAESAEPREARNLPSHGSNDQKPAGSADRVTLQVADDEGRQTRIRVTVTGNQIRAVITPPDSASARQLEQRMDQLHETLVRQGFVDPKLVVRAAPEAVSDAAMMASASSQDVRSTVPAGKDQPAGEQRQGRGQREQDRGDGHRHPQGHSRERDPRDRRR